jgi:hypothetical protein
VLAEVMRVVIGASLKDEDVAVFSKILKEVGVSD